MTKKGVKKPRSSEYGKPHAVRFKKDIDKELSLYCFSKEKRVSSIIQLAVEQYLKNGAK
jgi:hypothetical protein